MDEYGTGAEIIIISILVTIASIAILSEYYRERAGKSDWTNVGSFERVSMLALLNLPTAATLLQAWKCVGERVTFLLWLSSQAAAAVSALVVVGSCIADWTWREADDIEEERKRSIVAAITEGVGVKITEEEKSYYVVISNRLSNEAAKRKYYWVALVPSAV